MLFNSFIFLLFVLPATALLHHFAQKFRGASYAEAALLVVSLGCYASVNPANLPLLLASILFNFLIARQITRSKDPVVRLRWLRIGLTLNVLFLGTLKYSRFAVSTINSIAGSHFVPPQPWLPLGVSFTSSRLCI